MNTTSETFETVIIGAGQAGLSVGYHLARCHRPFVILDADERVGDHWRATWDTLRLYTPARFDGLPGMPFPAERWAFPTKDQMADYLEEYAERFELPVRSGTRVERLSAEGTGYLVETTSGRIHADNVVVATGTFGRTPYVPDFATQLDPTVLQMHSSDYRRPDQLRPGPALVVGASHSGADIAYEIGPHHATVLSGHVEAELPFQLDSRTAHVAMPIMFWAATHVLSLSTPVGRKMRPQVRVHGGPLLRVKKADLAAVGAEWTESRTAGVEDGMPVLDDGRRLEVANVVWCTGFRQDFSWIDLPVIGEDGWPLEDRGVVGAAPGLYFTGLAFQSRFTSMLVGGAGRDARYVAARVDRRSRSRSIDAPTRLEAAS